MVVATLGGTHRHWKQHHKHPERIWKGTCHCHPQHPQDDSVSGRWAIWLSFLHRQHLLCFLPLLFLFCAFPGTLRFFLLWKMCHILPCHFHWLRLPFLEKGSFLGILDNSVSLFTDHLRCCLLAEACLDLCCVSFPAQLSHSLKLFMY